MPDEKKIKKVWKRRNELVRFEIGGKVEKGGLTWDIIDIYMAVFKWPPRKPDEIRKAPILTLRLHGGSEEIICRQRHIDGIEELEGNESAIAPKKNKRSRPELEDKFNAILG